MAFPSQLFLVVPLLSVGCMQAVDHPERHAETRFDDLRARSDANLRSDTCDDGEAFGAKCGLLLERAQTEDFRTSFREKRCVEVDANTCQARFDGALDEWLAERYYAADVRRVAQVCTEHPGACDSPVSYERMLLQSHNRFVRSDTERMATEIRSDLEDERARRDAAGREITLQAITLGTVVLATHGHCHPSVFAAP